MTNVFLVIPQTELHNFNISCKGTPPTGPPTDLPGKCPSADWQQKGLHCYLFKVQTTDNKNFYDAEEVIITKILGPCPHVYCVIFFCLF